MYAGFNLTLSESEKSALKSYVQSGETLFQKQEQKVRTTLDKYINADGSLNATMIEEDWFRGIETNVFISHSHADESLVKAFAGYLHEQFGVESFIDSCVWGYANELLKMIDDKYCKTIINKDGSRSYDYDKRNQSTSHVHMMLNGALAKMINSTEGLIFMNTPNSIKAQDVEDKAKTASPWIYSELLMATEFPHQELSCYRYSGEQGLYEFAEEASFEYDVKVDELVELTFADLKKISECKYGKNPLRYLDELYFNKRMLAHK